MTQYTDEQLMQQYASGNVDAFAMLYEKHKGGLYRYILRQVSDKGQADDLFQEVWNKVIDGARSYQPTAKFSTWLYTLARHKVIDNVRHLKVVNNVFTQNGSDSEDGIYSVDSTSESLEQSRANEALKSCMGKLPVNQLESFLLKEEAGLTAGQIAEVVGTSLEASKSRLRYAYQSLRQCIAIRLGKVVA